MRLTLIPKRKMTHPNVPYGETGIYYADVVERKLMQTTQTTDLSVHEAAADPHTGYRLESADHTHQSTGLQAGTLDHGLALTGLTDNDHTQYILHSLATAVNDFLVASGSGAYVKKTLAETLTILGKAVASGLASLDGSSLVVQNPANATATPTASKIPIADGSGLLDGWVSLALKAPLASPQLTGTVNISGLTASQILATDGSKNLVSLAVATYPSLTELAYVKGVTSALQTQLGLLAPLASPTFTGTVTLASIAMSDQSVLYNGTSDVGNLQWRGSGNTAGKGTRIVLWGNNGGNGFWIDTPNAAFNADVTRLTISGGIATAVATWSNITHTDLVITSGNLIEGAGTGANGFRLKNLKNATASALSGTQKDIEIDIGGTPYYFTVYPTKA